VSDAARRAAVALTKARLSAKENAGWLTALLQDYADAERDRIIALIRATVGDTVPTEILITEIRKPVGETT
jgi:hypothetical protein